MTKGMGSPVDQRQRPADGVQVIDLGGGKTVKAIPVPGHTPGSYVFLYDGVLFTGDTAMFKQGRLDRGPGLFDSNSDQVKASVDGAQAAAGRRRDRRGLHRATAAARRSASDARCSTTSSAGSAAERASPVLPAFRSWPRCSPSAARPSARRRPTSCASSTRGRTRWRPATRAPPRRPGGPATRSPTIPAFLVHIGEAEEKAGEPAEAVESYRRYLREAPDASDRADIEQRLARLAPAAPAPAPAPRRTVETPGEFGGTPPASAPAPGRRRAGPAAAAPAATPAHVDAEHPAGKDQEDSGWNRYNTTAVIASGVTLALLGTAAFYGAEASSKESDINRLVTFRFPPPQYSSVAATYTSDMADGRSDAHAVQVLLLTAAGTGVVAAVFFVLDAVRTPPEAAPAAPPLPAVSVSIAPTGSGFGAQGAWSWRF